MRFRFKTGSQSGAIFLALIAVFFVAGCGSTTPAAKGTTTTTRSATATPVVTVTANTSLCDLMSLSQVGAVVGGTLSILERNVTKNGTENAANCTYLPAEGSGQRIAGEISYLFCPNGQVCYAADKHDDASRGETETTLSGLGDAAFWAVAAGKPYTLQLSVLKGNVLLVMTLLGTNADGSTMLNGAIGLARGALPSI